MKYIFSIFLAGSVAVGTAAQENKLSIYPAVQKLQSQNTKQDFVGLELQNAKWASFIDRTPVGKLKSDSGKDLWKLKLSIKKSFTAKNQLDRMVEGAYELSVAKGKINIVARDSLGIFYGLQTLAQIIEGNQITPVNIVDYPSVQYRGVVEGFYGTPWSLEDRVSQIKYYGLNKANTYIYGPKDDPYHSSPNWRKNYPAQEAENIKTLVKASNKNFVDFVWAIHPGQDIKWNKEDRENVIQKFNAMYDLGVRSFAVFFDDISGEGTNAHKQAELLNYLNDHFVKVKKDVKPLMMCPTEYNKSWANPKPDGYLSILGKELDPSIQIMWTGDGVVADVTKSTLDWVQERIKRPALVWWNFPVSDYVRDHLLLGASYGLEQSVTSKDMVGILSNPMEHAEASKPAIFGVADYGWNISKYEPENAWEEAVRRLQPHAYEAYLLFSENNADPGKSWHNYRREESTYILPYIEKLKTSIENENVNAENLNLVKNYFAKISESAMKIEAENNNPALVSEIKPWLDNFTILGKTGVSELGNLETSEGGSARTLWNAIVKGISEIAHVKTTAPADKKIKPVTGTFILKPFVEFLQKHNNRTLIQKITGQSTATGINPGIGDIETNISILKNARLSVDADGHISIPAMLEVFKIQPQEYFTVHLSQKINDAEITSQFESDSKNWMTIETSEDGKTWNATQQTEKDKKISAKTTGNSIAYIRAKNTSNAPVSLRLNKFSIQNGRQDGNTLFTRDLNVYSSSPLEGKGVLNEKSPIAHPSKLVVLSNVEGGKISIFAQSGAAKKQLIYNEIGSNYLEIELPKNTSSVQISSDQNLDIYEVLWK